ncbi:hypothetical protein Scep_028486 [Stephania cephalantha]|uniref:Uncharacterized protein n=1 Tax=Stephania cephalantha TaxID=152367 RepID=A0AAP0EA18_9MAGN
MKELPYMTFHPFFHFFFLLYIHSCGSSSNIRYIEHRILLHVHKFLTSINFITKKPKEFIYVTNPQ